MMSVNVYYHVDRACKLGSYSRTYLHLTMRDVTNRYYRTSWSACIHDGKISSGKCLSCEAIMVEDEETINLNIISSDSRQKLDLKCLKGDISDSLKYGSSDEPLGICTSEDIDEHNVHAETIAHLQICVNTLNLMQGKVHHAMIIEYGIENEVGSLLVQMYAKCRAVDDALMLFDTMHEQSTGLWNLIITIHLREGKLEASLLFYDKMQQMSVIATKVTYICMLSACTSKKDLVSGMLMHARIVACRFITDVVVTTCLVNMYGSCGHLDHAYRVFDNAEECDVISWNAMIGVYRQHGLNEEALLLFNRMQVEGISPNKVTFISILDVCAQQKSLGDGTNIQLCMMCFELKSDVSMCTAVINMYGKCGYWDEANFLFDNFEEKDIVLWNSMLALYSQRDEFKHVFRLLEQMTCEGFMPTKITYVSVFNACANKEALGRGKWVHASIVNSSFGTDLEVGNAILNFYSKHQSLLNAKCMFERMLERNVITWSGMIAAYAQDGQTKEAVQIFIKMQQERVMPNEITLISILQAFDNKSMLDDIRKTHYYAMLEGFNKGVTLGTALINMYSKYGNIKEARSIFDEIPKSDILCWTAIISSYIQHRQEKEALLLFNLMKKRGILPDKLAIINILSAYSSLMTFSEYEEIFACIHQCQLELDEVVGSAVLSIYGRFGKLKLCMGLFEKLPKKYVSTWNSMIAAYVQNGQFKDALHLFEKMNDAGVIPDKDSFVSTLAACASEASLIEGKKVHDIIRKCGFILNDVMTCALISMYGKCGCLGFSESVFGNIEKHDVLSWNAMIGVYAQHGESVKAIQLVEQMQQKGIMPDTITMVSILNAMSHTGLLHEAFHCILLMENSYNIIPSSDHYVCIMDLIRRAGRINEVGCFIRCMPFQPKTVSYMSFLGACQCSIFLEHGEFAAKHMSELDPKNAGPYVSLSNIYATMVEE